MEGRLRSAARAFGVVTVLAGIMMVEGATFGSRLPPAGADCAFVGSASDSESWSRYVRKANAYKDGAVFRQMPEAISWIQIPMGKRVVIDGKPVYAQRDPDAAEALAVSLDHPDTGALQLFSLKPGDVWPHVPSHRSEFSSDMVIANGETVYGSFWFEIRPDAVFDQRWNIFGQMHSRGRGTNGSSPPLAFSVTKDGRWQVSTRHSAEDRVRRHPEQIRYLAPERLSLGVPHHVAFEWRPDPEGPLGQLKVWFDGGTRHRSRWRKDRIPGCQRLLLEVGNL